MWTIRGVEDCWNQNMSFKERQKAAIALNYEIVAVSNGGRGAEAALRAMLATHGDLAVFNLVNCGTALSKLANHAW